MENRTKRSSLKVSLVLLVAVTAAAAAPATFAVVGVGVAPLPPTRQIISAYASVSHDVSEINESISQTTKNNNSNNTITLSEKPFLIEHGRTAAANPINQTHIAISLVGNGTIMLPNSTETVMTKDTGYAIARLTPTGNIVNGQIRISTEDGSENGTVFFTEIGQNQKGVGVAYFTTNSTGRLAFLDNMIAVIQDEIQPNGDTLIKAWEWKDR